MKLGKLEVLAISVLLVTAIGQLGAIAAGWVAAAKAGADLPATLLVLAAEPRAARALAFTAMTTVACLILQSAIAVPTALMVYLAATNVRAFPLLVPALIAPATFGMAAYLILSPGLSPIIHLWPSSSAWLAELFVNPALMFATVVAVDSWQWIPPLTVAIVLWGIRPAAVHMQVLRTEGAGWADYLKHALVPSIAPVLAAYMAIRTFDLLRLHDTVVALFGSGGPGYAAETFSMYLTKISFQRGRETEAAVLSFLYLGSMVTILRAVVRSRRVSTLLPWNTKVL